MKHGGQERQGNNVIHYEFCRGAIFRLAAGESGYSLASLQIPLANPKWSVFQPFRRSAPSRTAAGKEIQTLRGREHEGKKASQKVRRHAHDKGSSGALDVKR